MDYISFIYAFVIVIGGAIGFIKKGSVISLIMGCLFGGLSCFGAYQTSQNPSNFWFLLLSSSILFVVMGYRSLNSGKFMPAGLVAFLSLLMVIRLGVRLME